MDYAFLSTLIGIILMVLLSYDLACQYYKNLLRRIPGFPEYMRPPEHIAQNMRFVIPKKHWAVHGPNHSRFSLNFVRWVGRTYGEGIESSWSTFNPVSMSTMEMAASTREEVLDDHFGDWNHQKTIGFGKCHILSAISIIFMNFIENTRECL